MLACWSMVWKEKLRLTSLKLRARDIEIDSVYVTYACPVP
jgi:hypothetical protein